VGFRELMRHQVKALAYCRRTRHPALFLEMRLGKTLVVIRWAKLACPKPSRILVIAPLTTLVSWANELTLEGETWLRGWGLSEDSRNEVLCDAFQRITNRRVWVLVNYEAVRASAPVISTTRKDRFGITHVNKKRLAPFIAGLDWYTVVLDESTAIRNPQAQISDLMVRLFREVPHRFVLSGLPAPESLLDLFQQFRFLDGKFVGFHEFWPFRAHHFVGPTAENRWVPKRESREAIREAVHRRAFVLQRRDAGIGSRKVYEKRHVGMSPRQRRMYTELERLFIATLTGGEEVSTRWIVVQQLWLARIAGGHDPKAGVIGKSKSQEILHLLNGELSAERVVIWCRFRAEVELVSTTLLENDISTVEIVGGVSSADRRDRLTRFASPRGPQVLIATQKTARHGLDCSQASTAIYYSNTYSCEDRLQSEDRILHPKKSEPLLYLDLISEGTIDETVANRVHMKRYSAQQLMEDVTASILERGTNGNRPHD